MPIRFGVSVLFTAVSTGFLFGCWLTPRILTLVVIQQELLFLVVSVLLFGIFTIKKQSKILIVFCFFLGLVCGYWRFVSVLPHQDFSAIWSLSSKKIVVRAEVEQVERRLDKQRLVFKNIHLDNKDKQGKLLVWLPPYPEYAPGNRLELSCLITLPQAKDGFAYDYFLAAKGIFAECRKPYVIAVDDSVNRGDTWRRYLGKIIDDNLSEPLAGFAQAIVLGRQWLVSKDLLQIFSDSGTVHIISVSGFHMSILAWLILEGLIACGCYRRWASLPASLIIIAYTILIGAPAAAVRSAIMAVIFLVSLAFGLLNYSINSLLAAAVVMSILNPWLIIADLGFQLSFLSVAGLIFLVEPLEYLLSRIIKFRLEFIKYFVQAAAVTTATQLATWPLIVLAFGRVSTVAIIANFIIAPLSAFWLVVIMISLIASLFLPWLSFLWWVPVLFLGQLLLIITRFFASWPVAAITMANPGELWLWLYYIWLIISVIIFKYLTFKKKIVIN